MKIEFQTIKLKLKKNRRDCTIVIKLPWNTKLQIQKCNGAYQASVSGRQAAALCEVAPTTGPLRHTRLPYPALPGPYSFPHLPTQPSLPSDPGWPYLITYLSTFITSCFIFNIKKKQLKIRFTKFSTYRQICISTKHVHHNVLVR